MKKYEEETGKYAIWRGQITDGFKRWKKGEKIYDKDKERISFYVNEDIKESWKEFADKNKYPTISKFIRDAVNNFIEKKELFHSKGLGNLQIDSLSQIVYSFRY